MYLPKPTKLGHLVLKVRDVQESYKFYTEVVGLKWSDWIDDRMVFLRSNGTDHHDLALLQMNEMEIEKSKQAPSRVEHFSYHIETFDEIKKISEMLVERGIEIDRGFGKHGPGDNTFLVFHDPDGNFVEFYSDMTQIDENNPYEPRVWDGSELDTFDIWHLNEFIVDPPERVKIIKDKMMNEEG